MVQYKDSIFVEQTTSLKSHPSNGLSLFRILWNREESPRCISISSSANPSYFQHRLVCTTISRLPFICDLHHQLSHANLNGIELAYERYKPYFYQNNRTTLAVLIVRQLEAPTSATSVYEEQSYSCLFENECNRVDSEVVLGFVNNVKIFIKVCFLLIGKIEYYLKQ
ncbi:hypothetical protein OESDEN_00100 [Oesophagostomum dentatum]|uniref:Uncharacterized protein n=1 Tax=Oesophagostomum dentatum TaxID=61180 RepID=A0A0B1TWQ9_OESDE|nr:hypothetical protein OESDEN_00100 [Oesophagostomum dentatum]